MLDRLMERVSVEDRGHPSPCWIWGGLLMKNGYGRISRGGHAGPMILTHRAAYEVLVVPVPEGLQIDHLCRVRACCNPDHLEPVTCRENLLRGSGWVAVNARKTECPQGHPYDEANTYRRSNGRRVCRTCGRERALVAYHRKKVQ